MAHGQESSTEAGGPPRCVTGCGFFGSTATMNMCSKCYLDHVKATQVAAAPVVEGKIKAADAATLAFKTPANEHDSAAAAADAATLAFKTPASEHDSAAAAAAEAPAKKAAPTRCMNMTCKKKVGLLGFGCRCGGTFCSLHRYADGHACEFDYKKADREKIAQQNPLVVASKIDKI